MPTPTSATPTPTLRVAILALPGVVTFDLAAACETFDRVQRADGTPGYSVQVCAESSPVAANSHLHLTVAHGLEALADAHTVVIPGVDPVPVTLTPAVRSALRQAQARGARIVSLCSGAFVLAEAGLLDGRRATTHWLAAELMARHYPQIDVDPAVLFVDEGQMLTSAGAAAGLDLCLHIVRRDHGAAAAAQVARLAVVPLQRDGGQAQYIRRPAPCASADGLSPLLAWMLERLDQPITVEQMAGRACTSARTLTRRFRQEFGVAPLQWLIRARVARAQELLECTDLTIEQVAVSCGLGAASNLRTQFVRTLSVSPSDYRRRFALKMNSTHGRPSQMRSSSTAPAVAEPT